MNVKDYQALVNEARRGTAGYSEGDLRSLAKLLADAVEALVAERDALRAQLDKATAVMRQYENWFDGAPEDSWRLQRDMMAALDMVEVTD